MCTWKYFSVSAYKVISSLWLQWIAPLFFSFSFSIYPHTYTHTYKIKLCIHEYFNLDLLMVLDSEHTSRRHVQPTLSKGEIYLFVKRKDFHRWAFVWLNKKRRVHFLNDFQTSWLLGKWTKDSLSLFRIVWIRWRIKNEIILIFV